MPGGPVVTPEQIEAQKAKKEARAAKKAAAAASNAAASGSHIGEGSSMTNVSDRGRFLKRNWIELTDSPRSSGRRKFSLITWNLLAQSLIRRELFPGSDCLKWGDRKHMLLAELEYHRDVDVLCFQECDRLEELRGALPDHLPITAFGRDKEHGCVISYRHSKFIAKASKVIHLDEEILSPVRGTNESDSQQLRRSRGGSRRTKNIALMVALGFKDENQGVVVVTTHLFWHPKYLYERVRQIIIILRNIRLFQTENRCEDWPVIFAGDLNTSPSEAPYQLLANPDGILHPEMLWELEESRHVHSSINVLYESNGPPLESAGSTSGIATPAEMDNEEAITSTQNKAEVELPNPRPPESDDGILEVDDLQELMKSISSCGGRSVYDSSTWHKYEQETFGGRGGFENQSTDQPKPAGWREPNYTSFTPIWHLTLDYIFILNPLPKGGEPVPIITSVIRPASKEELGDGLPRKGVCASDHLAMGCKLEW